MELELFAHSEVLAPFFFLIGMQLRNEISHPKEILLPTLAALGGMLFPALIFISLNSDPVIAQGWPLVMPTDIAIAKGSKRLYWTTAPDNETARKLYDKVAITDRVQYKIFLNQ